MASNPSSYFTDPLHAHLQYVRVSSASTDRLHDIKFDNLPDPKVLQKTVPEQAIDFEYERTCVEQLQREIEAIQGEEEAIAASLQAE